MSRCFPFPPSGYERNIKADEPSLLKKEKHRESNKKKDKKDKQKKERRERDRTDGKRSEKKHKKEKQQNKKEEGDLDKDGHRYEGLFPNEKTAGPPNVHLNKFCEKERDWENKGSDTVGEKRVQGPSGINNHLASQTKIFKSASGSVRRNIDEERKFNNQLLNKNNDGVVKVMDSKKKTNEKPAVVENKDDIGFNAESKFCGNVLGQNVVGQVKLPGRCSGSPMVGRETKEKEAIFPLEKKPDKKMELEREKVKEKGSNYKIAEKRTEEDIERPSHKDKKKEEKVKAVNELKKHVHISSKRDDSEDHLLTVPIAKKELSASLSDGTKGMPKSGSQDTTLLGKRKDIKLNGVYDEHMTGSNKLARTTPSTHPLTENGKRLEHCQNSAAFAGRPPMNIKVERTFAPDEFQRVPMHIKVDGNECKTEPIRQSSRKSEVSVKPPHPNTKYLSQVLRVPKLDERLEFDDQEWLLSSDSSQARRPQVETFGVEVEPKVWAKALWLELVDIFALPYVISH